MTRVDIQAEGHVIRLIKNQLNSPVTAFSDYGLGLASEPIFALWNIIRPDKEEYDSYFNLNSSKSWFAWNLYNWGTLYDCMNFDSGEIFSTLESHDENHLKYRILTPVKSPGSALETLKFYYKTADIQWK